MISPIELNTDPLLERKKCINVCLEKKVYDQLVKIIIEYDYHFRGKLYKIININDHIYSICPLSDYKIIICSYGNTLKILDIMTNEYTTITHTHKGIYRAVTAPNGNIITISTHVGTIDVYDRNYNCIQNLGKHIISCVNCLPDGRIVTSISNDITIWNPDNGKPDIEIKTDFIICCIACNDQLLVGGDYSGTIKIWYLSTMECKNILFAHQGKIQCIAVNHDGLIISGSSDATIKIWNNAGQCLSTLERHSNSMCNFLILPDGMLLSPSYNLLKMWSLIQNKCVLSLKTNNVSYCTVLKNGLVTCVSELSKIFVYY